MKIVDHKAFLTLPAGVFYCKGEPMAFGDLCVKADTVGGNDWWYRSLNGIDAHDTGELFDRYDEMVKTGASYPMDDGLCRDGLYQEEAIFLILERGDLEKLRALVDVALAGAS